MSTCSICPFEDDERRAVAEPALPTPAAARRDRSRVTELTVRIRDLLETEFSEVWVEGELSNCRALEHRPPVLHAEGRRRRRSRGVMFRSALRYLKFKPADGLRVVARGTRLASTSRRASISSSASTWSRRASARCSSRSIS